MYDLENYISDLEKKNPGETGFIQVAKEVLSSVIDVVNSTPKYIENKILERLVEPDMVHQFKVTWEDDEGKQGDYVDFLKGANIAGFKKIAEAMCEQGF